MNDLETTKGSSELELLPFSEVKNRVLKINPHFPHLPFKLEEGTGTRLGVFAGQENGASRKLEVWAQHGRSALLGRVVFRDDEGRTYRDIDLKGIGHLVFGNGLVTVERPVTAGPNHFGFVNLDEASWELEMAEEFIKERIRTYRILAIIGLEEIVLGGEKISREQAVESRVFEVDFKPVVEVRAFGTKARIADLFPPTREMSALLLDDAKRMVSTELGKESLSDEEFVVWFARTFGENVGRMHKKGWIHDNISSHNVTLDCRLVDLATAKKSTRNIGTKSDLDGTEACLRQLVGNIDQLRARKGEKHEPLFIKGKAFRKLFREAYDQKMSRMPWMRNGFKKLGR